MKKIINQSTQYPISSATIADQLIFVSGQIGIDPHLGKLVEGGIQAETIQALNNLDSQLVAAGSDRSQVLKTTVYLTNFDDYQIMNKVYQSFFINQFPARSALEVTRLPADACVEIECIACIKV